MAFKQLNESGFYGRLSSCIRSSIRPALTTSLWLLSITIPVSLAVVLLQYFGILQWMALCMRPVFKLVGLPGESGLVFLTSIFLNIYSAIAVIGTLSFSIRDITIIAIMCLISHNLIIETAITRKTGSSLAGIIFLRLGMSFVAAWLLNLMLPVQVNGSHSLFHATLASHSFIEIIQRWAVDSFFLTAKIIIIVAGLMFLQNILNEFGIILYISRGVSPILKLLGLPVSTSFLWIVAYTLGLGYGGAIMIQEVEEGRLTRDEADLLNHHIAVSHSLLEDTLLFVAIGVSAGWIIFPRIVLAFFSVWSRRLLKRIKIYSHATVS
jgi:hypothetical protein